MAKFLEITDSAGDAVLVNLDRVELIYTSKSNPKHTTFTWLGMDGEISADAKFTDIRRRLLSRDCLS